MESVVLCEVIEPNQGDLVWKTRNFTAVREMSGFSVKIREISEKILSGKIDQKLY